MKVLILTLDTRGDVQPFVALPRGLANAGHEAVLAAPHRFEGFARTRAYRSPESTTAALNGGRDSLSQADLAFVV